MKPAIIMEMSCTKYVCGDMLSDLWPDPSIRPHLVQETVGGFSAAHRSHFQMIASANGGRMIGPILKNHLIDPAQVSEVILCGFSAGCWGVAEMLSDPDAGAVSAVLCVDGLHYPTGAKFEPFARRAAAGDVMLVDLYSAIPVSGYTSTRDSARRLAGVVGAQQVGPLLPGADESWEKGEFYAVGFPGSGKQAHIDQANAYQPLAWEKFIAPWTGGGGTGVRIEPGGKKSTSGGTDAKAPPIDKSEPDKATMGPPGPLVGILGAACGYGAVKVAMNWWRNRNG